MFCFTLYTLYNYKIVVLRIQICHVLGDDVEKFRLKVLLFELSGREFDGGNYIDGAVHPIIIQTDHHWT